MAREVVRGQRDPGLGEDAEGSADSQLRETGNALEEGKDLLDLHALSHADFVWTLVHGCSSERVGAIVAHREVGSHVHLVERENEIVVVRVATICSDRSRPVSARDEQAHEGKSARPRATALPGDA